jgi:two-component system, chemotaxis family, sensor kinase CheA
VQRNALAVGLAALLLGCVGASLIAVSLARRLRAIGRVAEAVAGGELDQPAVVVKGSLDEIGVVAFAFNAMLAHIRELVAQIRQSAKDEQGRLEALVAERTRDLDRRNADLKQVLDNVGQGFVALDRSGKLSRERSRVLGEWFPSGAGCETFGELLATADPALGPWFALGWESLQDGLMPIEVSIDQLPNRVGAGERELGVEYRPILAEGGEMERVLVVVSDLTDARRRARAEADEREVTGLLSKLIADRAGFLEFFGEAHALVEQVVEATRLANDIAQKRALHTLKGNAGLYELGTVAELCHALEERLADGERLGDQDIERLRDRWQEISAKVQSFVAGSNAKLELDDGEHAELLGAIERGESHAELHRRVQAWRLEPARARLARIADQATALAERLGKGPMQVEIEANDVRVERERWSDFWLACVHVVRNAIDHGLETPEERRALGKPVPARLRLVTSVAGGSFRIEFADDGRGIDWNAARIAARSLGLPSETQAELGEALFADGLSTRRQATELSGRGVGLAAVREACTKLGGRAEVHSVAGQGTTFRFTWPVYRRPFRRAAARRRQSRE